MRAGPPRRLLATEQSSNVIVKLPSGLWNRATMRLAVPSKSWKVPMLTGTVTAGEAFDRSGRIRPDKFGEGSYAEQEQVIRELLDEPGPTAMGSSSATQ